MARHRAAVPLLVNLGKSIPHLQTRKRERAGVKRRPVCLASHRGASGFVVLVKGLLDDCADTLVVSGVLAVSVADMSEEPSVAVRVHE